MLEGEETSTFSYRPGEGYIRYGERFVRIHHLRRSQGDDGALLCISYAHSAVRLTRMLLSTADGTEKRSMWGVSAGQGKNTS